MKHLCFFFYSQVMRHPIQTGDGETSVGEKAKNMMNCCPLQSVPDAERPAELLACIFNFTHNCIAPKHPEIYNLTAPLLRPCLKYDPPA
ncbi:hypothetical protein lerEdw1_000286, partial [Lerista edwardsae]